MIRNAPPAALLFALTAAWTSALAQPHSGAHAHMSPPDVRGDAAAGAQVFKTSCAVCHGKQGEGTGLAPALVGVVGAKAASSSYPAYTPALKASGMVWSPGKLEDFLAGPAKLVPGTAMRASVAKDQDRDNLVAYLATLRK